MIQKKVKRKVIHIEEELKKFVDQIEKEGPFKGLDHHEVFTMALVLGFNSSKKKKIKKRLPGGFFREDTFTSSERAIISSIAIADSNNLAIISEENSDEKYNLAEDYSTAGFSILKDKLALSGTFQKKLELELRKKLKEIKKIKF
tara:strand:+ start:654 stop:1088 length:435 start_codon:yes stop_codon:yes gene_type:complete